MKAVTWSCRRGAGTAEGQKEGHPRRSLCLERFQSISLRPPRGLAAPLVGSLADLSVQILIRLSPGSILTLTLSDPPGTTQPMTRCAVITLLQSQELLGPRVFLDFLEIKWR